MIRDPINDVNCLGQLTRIASELAPTTLVQMVAQRLGTRDQVIRWMQSLPQSDDDGHEAVRYVQCDVSQRVRLLPDDPNCVERATGAMMLLEVLDPRTPRALATVERPMRHTGLVEQRDGHWMAVDLFPRRNFSWSDFGKDVFQGVHQYVGKPILSFYGLGGAADQLGDAENKLIGRDKKTPEKKDQPSISGKPDGKPSPRPQPAGAQPRQKLTLASLASVVGSGAKETKPTKGGGDQKHGKEEASEGRAGTATSVDGKPAGSKQAADGDRRNSHDAREEAKRWWWSLG